VSAAASSQRAALVAELFAKEGRRVHALAHRICSGRDADDLVQETFLNAFRAIHQLEDPRHPRPWLYAIAHRACSRLRRRRAGEPQRLESLEELLPRPGPTIPQLADLGAGPHANRLRAEARELVEQGLAQLPEAFRVPLLLADIAELRLPEIAEILGLKEATVKTRVHRARLKLRDVLARGLPQRPTPAATHGRQVCLDLLGARLDAYDRGIAFPYTDQALCERCQAVFATLDLAVSTCGALARGDIPAQLKSRIRAALAAPAQSILDRRNPDAAG
jgi:RNA polymerase sigma-70 factor, ECF subfamily